MKKDSVKNQKINSQFKKELSVIVHNELTDPRISSTITVTDAYVTTDLKLCKVYLSIPGSDDIKENTLKGLQSAKGYIRSQLASRINLRNTPELEFVIDKTQENADHIEELLAQIKKNENN